MLYKRKISDEVVKYLNKEQIVVLHGARQVGKTSIMLLLNDYLIGQNDNTFIVDFEDKRMREIANSGGDKFTTYLKSEGKLKDKSDKKLFLFLDEIQLLDDPSNFMKLIYDHHKEIKMIVSGSSTFEIKSKFSDSLVGRTFEFEVFPLSFEEFLVFKNKPFKLNGTNRFIDQELKELYGEYAMFGGYPAVVLETNKEIKEKMLVQIVETYAKKDIRDLANVQEVNKFNKLLEALATQCGNMLNVRELSNTCDLSATTVEKYLFILEQTYIIKLVKPWSTNKRSELFKTPKIFFFDSGLANVLATNALPEKIGGHDFENSVWEELVKKYGKNNIYYWRTKSRLEIDFILKQGDKLLPIEAKLNFFQFQNAPFRAFARNYGTSDHRMVALEGDRTINNGFYPWEL